MSEVRNCSGSGGAGRRLSGADLAINGGNPVRTKPWKENLTYGEEEVAAVVDVMRSGRLSLFEGSHAPDPPFDFWGGPKVQELEEAWASYYGTPFAVSMNSATSGLYAAIGALGIGYGDEVVVSPYTMTAAATCALVYGAIPVFADVDPMTGCLDPASIAENITDRTRGIVVVHQFGIPADMDPILELAEVHSLRIVEDCAQAHGARYKGRPVGTIGDIGVFSLNVNKTIQTGEGCVCTTQYEDTRYRLALIRNHGEAVVEPAGYDAITNTIGFNYRPTELQAAIAIEQLRKLDDLNKTRSGYVRSLAHSLAPVECVQPLVHAYHGGEACDGSDGCVATHYVFPFRFYADRAGVAREEFVAAVRAEGIVLYEGYTKPLYLQPMYQRMDAFKHQYPFRAPVNIGARMNYHAGACPNAEQLYSKEMVINEHVRPPHDPADINDIEVALLKVLGHLTN